MERCPCCGYCPHCGRSDHMAPLVPHIVPIPTPYYQPFQPPYWHNPSTGDPLPPWPVITCGGNS